MPLPFVKLHRALLDSTIWSRPDESRLFLTALLMADRRDFTQPTPQIAIRNLELTGWIVPPGRYGFVPASSLGLLHRARIPKEDTEAAFDVLERLGEPDVLSRSPEHDGRRLIRMAGGFIVLNYRKYQGRADHTGADRMSRYRTTHHPPARASLHVANTASSSLES